MPTKLHILHTVASMDNEAAGTTICVRRFAEELALLEVDVSVCSVGAAGTVQRDGYVDDRFAPSYLRIPILRAMHFSSAMQKGLDIASRDVDIIHNHGLWLMPNVYAAWAAKKAGGVSLVFSPHGMLCPGALQFSKQKKWAFWNMLQGRAAQMASCFHATCEEEAEDIRAYGLSMPVAVIANGVDFPPWEKKVLRPKRRRVVSLGRIHPKKGLDRLVSAWAQVEPDYPDWELSIVGPGENNHAAELAKQAERLGLQKCIISGPVFGSEKDELLRAADIFVLPTLSENFALTVAESLAVGTPVISTKGAPWQGLEENDCGWWIDHGVEPLAAALRHAMALPQNELDAMGERGRAWMERDFAWDEIARQMLEVYQWLAGKGERPQCVRVD